MHGPINVKKECQISPNSKRFLLNIQWSTKNENEG